MRNNKIQTFTSIVLTKDNIQQNAALLNKQPYADLADLITRKPLIEKLIIFEALTPNRQVKVFEFLPFSEQKGLLYALPEAKAAVILNELSPDDRTAFFEELPSKIVNQLLKLLSPNERAVTLKLLGYPEDSVGRLMTPDYIAIKKDWTVKEVLNYVRAHGKDSETLNVLYVVDDSNVLIDDIRIREFLISPLDTRVDQLRDRSFVSLLVADTQEYAVNVFRKYDRVALPVVDKDGILLGIVTIDDILDVLNKEDTKDIQKIGGVAALDEPYMETPFLVLMRKRAGWLVLLFLGELLTASAMGYFQNEISKAVVLALFIPLIISSGGNAGSQAATLIVRAIALNEVGIKDWYRIMRREMLSGLFLGLVLGTIGFMRISLWGFFFKDIYGVHWLLLAFTVYLSLIGVVLWGTLSGSMLPLIMRYFGFDPATSSTPFIATLVDVTGLVIYFSIALFTLHGTLL